MHLESLLADLDSQFEQYERSARAAQAWELAEAEAGRTALVDRLRAVEGGALAVTTRSGRVVSGKLLQARQEFLLLLAADSSQMLVPMGAVVSVRGVGRQLETTSSQRVSYTVAAVLRQIMRTKRPARFNTAAGDITGRIIRVGADHVDVLSMDKRDLSDRVTLILSAIEIVTSI